MSQHYPEFAIFNQSDFRHQKNRFCSNCISFNNLLSWSAGLFHEKIVNLLFVIIKSDNITFFDDLIYFAQKSGHFKLFYFHIFVTLDDLVLTCDSK